MLNAGMGFARRKGLMEAPDLSKSALMDNAARFTGYSDFGDDWFHKPLDRLLENLHDQARLNAAGEWAAKKQFEKVLHDRLWAEQWFREHPEILGRPLPRPVFIVGPMRSGTTRLHRLLSADHRFSHMRSFETISPVPRPGFVPGKPDPRVRLAERIMRVARFANPRTLTIHPTGPYEPEEELGLLVNSFWGMKHEAQWWVPDYGRWCEREDAVPAYRQMARLLKLVGWSQQVSSLRPWVLKTPQHMMDLPALMKVFPDARLIFTHRDPLSVVGSAASLAWNQTIIYSDHAQPERIGKEWLRKTNLQIARMRQARKMVPGNRIIDVRYDEMDRDWRGTMRRIYEFLDMDIEPSLPAMQHYMDRTAIYKRHPHQYSLEEFGLSAGQVLHELNDYITSFGIPLEDRMDRLAKTGVMA
ncbi:sulfotransferase [Altericroceibacterium spongiae]|uniref:Sulfotransferase n=2 Tax=Altericroceibacterium spongiae TaxID=2320269 RepID=A0A420EKQ1_9SPHN|nr:sulfotransferase [Altericroceibacterium spongiae]